VKIETKTRGIEPSYCTVSLIDSARWEKSIFLQTLKVGASDRSAQKLQKLIQTEFHSNFLTEVWPF
jgi:hypothetical protein